MALGKPEFEALKNQVETLDLKIGIWTHQTQASIKTYCINAPSVLVYHEDDGLTTTAVDAGTNFGTLDNDAPPAVVGVLIPVGDAAELLEVKYLMSEALDSLSADMTDAVATFCGAANSGVTGKSGVTASGNIAFTLSLTTLDIDEDNATAQNQFFWIRVKYRKTQPR